MIIDNLKEKYIKSIALIEKQNFSEPWSENAIRAELENPCGVYFVATEDGEAVGYIGIHIIFDEAYVTNIAVDDKFKRCGIGRRLMECAADHCKKVGCTFITLEVRSSNTAAINLYKSLNFEKLGVRRNFYSNPTEDADIMTLYFRRD